METEQPKARTESTILSGSYRFTVLTERMIRIEWSALGRFDDRATLSVVNRRLPPVDFRVRRNGGSVTVETEAVTLVCADHDGRPSPGILHADIRSEGKTVTWRYGARDTGNLGGTIPTLDGIRGRTHFRMSSAGTFDDPEPVDLGEGLVSRSGWTLFDDSSTVALEKTGPGREWVVPRDLGEYRDLYLLAYGRDFRKAVGDASLVFGRQPLPPRYALGYWYSRYWAYTDREIEELADQFDTMNVPIDVMVIDMDWHLPGWTGYTWDRRYFPDPEGHLARLRKRGLKVTLNLHPADGVGRHEESFPVMCEALGLDPAGTERIPFDCTDPRFIESYFRVLHHPKEDAGVDFWWMDWQQGERTEIEGLKPLPWINKLHWDDQAVRKGKRRPLSFSRYGGLGAGRYPVGFSGDTVSVWESLQFQPYFTATAANVLYGYWSHDIGGHMPGEIDPELYTRWIQFGAFSPILRTHTTKNPRAERRVWEYPEPYKHIMTSFIRLRYRLIPYLYTENRKCFDSGVSAVRPMYYDHPGEEAAYAAEDQYLFGDSMIVAPVMKPVNPASGQARVRVWLPEGEWYDTAHGVLLRGGSVHRRDYRIEELPVFVKAGAMVPMQGAVTRLNEGSYPELEIVVYPGTGGSCELYEDDGATTEYLEGRAVRIPISWRRKDRGRIVEIGPAAGSFTGFRRKRRITLRLAGARPAGEVEISNGNRAASEYDGYAAAAVVPLGAVDLTVKTVVRIAEDPAANDAEGAFTPASAPLAGLTGILRRLDAVARSERLVSPVASFPGEERLCTDAAQTGHRISLDPSRYVPEIERLASIVTEIPGYLGVFRRGYMKRRSGFTAAEEIDQVLSRAQADARRIIRQFRL